MKRLTRMKKTAFFIIVSGLLLLAVLYGAGREKAIGTKERNATAETAASPACTATEECFAGVRCPEGMVCHGSCCSYP